MTAASLRRAIMPDSTATAFIWAPLKSSVQRASSSKLTSLRSTFMVLEWMRRIWARADSAGWGSSTLRSSLPLRKRAGSSVSGLLVAAMTLILSLEANPSSWFSSSNIVRCTSLSPDCSPPKRLVPMASSSSMKMMAPARPSLEIFSFASSNASRIILAPSPIYICTNCGPESFRNTAPVFLAQARARRVFPVPGGPYKSTPLGARMPMLSNLSACVMGSTTASISSWICLSRPPMSV
mmetsp:Transcript_14537/g.29057  ORF Transcript_14537/g.29057 Transcript_14537/m.29057 type:complete len:238 (-) Transcript_14537:573-1286(-)